MNSTYFTLIHRSLASLAALADGKRLAAVVLLAAFTSSTVLAAPFTAWRNQAAGNGFWDELGNWTDNGNDPSAPVDPGTTPTQFAGNDFFSGTFQVRSAGTTTFGGDSLTMQTGGTLLLFGGSGSPNIGSLIMDGGNIGFGTGGQTPMTNTFTIDDMALTQAALVDTNGRGFTFDIGNLTGSGGITVTEGGDISFSIADATAYTGILNVGSGGGGSNINDVVFLNSFVSGGGLVVGESFTAVTLDATVTFESLMVGSTVYGPGIYTVADLNADNPGVFSGAGSIAVGVVVPEPTTAALLIGAIGLLGLRRRRTGRA